MVLSSVERDEYPNYTRQLEDVQDMKTKNKIKTKIGRSECQFCYG